jgi:hypothetical protein
MNRRRLEAAVALMVFVAAAGGCNGASAPTSAEPAAEPPTACMTIPHDRCATVAAAVRERLGATAPITYLEVNGTLCDGPCPEDAIAPWEATVAVEFADGRPAAAARLSVTDDVPAWQPMAPNRVRVEPRSPALVGTELRLDLGHCGLYSGIDVDGSFWDPVGQIDGTHPTLINATPATFRLAGPANATLAVDGGPIVQLVRHTGPKHLPGCD